MSFLVGDYLALITSEHNDKPKYVATVTATVQPFVDGQAVTDSLPGLFDVDVAVGQQLDFVGQWVGRTRYISTPLAVFFSFGIEGLGFGQGIWYSPFDAMTGLTTLPDYEYRILLKATIAANYWDGTISGAYEAWNTLLNPFGYGILIQDNGDMTMLIALIGQAPTPIVEALFTTGELDLKPAGVRLTHVLPTVYPAGDVGGMAGTPIFGFGVDNVNIGGFGHGAWGQFVDSE